MPQVLPADNFSRAGLDRALGTLSGVLRSEQGQRRARQALLFFLLLCCVQALARLIWVVVPSGPGAWAADPGPLLNPPQVAREAGPEPAVSLDALLSSALFGEPGTVDALAQEIAAQGAVRSPELDGIERGARETRLDLRLLGVAAMTDAGLGQAVIEHRREQALYAVGDSLPAGDRISLAKVMPRQVVIDNQGTYELLKLFDRESDAFREFVQAGPGRAAAASPEGVRSAPAAAAGGGGRGAASRGEIAARLHERLYSDPRSLAEVVQVSAERADGELLGYRVRPGRDDRSFLALGFEPGDLVLSVNGMTLDDPGNALRLYQTMRTASSAVFRVRRGGEELGISVSLPGASP